MITLSQFVKRVRQYGSIGERVRTRYDDVIEWARGAYSLWVEAHVQDLEERKRLMVEADAIIEREYESRVPAKT